MALVAHGVVHILVITVRLAMGSMHLLGLLMLLLLLLWGLVVSILFVELLLCSCNEQSRVIV
jgi:hypothetical protein